jgi:hypothetical protein
MLFAPVAAQGLLRNQSAHTLDSIELGCATRTSRRKVKAIGGFRVERPKNPSRFERRLRLAAAADGARVAHKKVLS